jgi:hypothetical protein
MVVIALEIKVPHQLCNEDWKMARKSGAHAREIGTDQQPAAQSIRS